MENLIGVVGAVGAVATAVSVFYLARQTVEASKARQLANRLALLAAHDRVTDLAMQVDALFIANPELRKYFYAGEDHHSAPRREQERITALAEYISDFIENAMVHEVFLEDLTIASWHEYYLHLVQESPAVREFLHSNGEWYNPAVTALLSEMDRESRRKLSRELVIRELSDADDSELLAAVQSLYMGAFPEYERAPFETVFVNRRDHRRVLIAEAPRGNLAGLAVLLPLRRHTEVFLLEYLAVAPRLRSLGVGSQMLDACRSLVSSLGGDRVFMEVEDPEVGQSSTNAERRWRFYARNAVEPASWIHKYWMPDLTHPDRRIPMRLLEMKVRNAMDPCRPRDLLEDLYCTAYGKEAAGVHLPGLLSEIS